MSRHKTFGRWEIPGTVVQIVKTMCADYDRRAIIIRSGEKTQSDYERINAAIDRGLLCAEETVRRFFLEDIAYGRGYWHSPSCAVLSKNAYYTRKHQIIHDIAVELRLLNE
jgi:hypothetical protein